MSTHNMFSSRNKQNDNFRASKSWLTSGHGPFTCCRPVIKFDNSTPISLAGWNDMIPKYDPKTAGLKDL